MKEQQEWKIPPCISTIKCYCIVVRLSGDGEGTAGVEDTSVYLHNKVPLYCIVVRLSGDGEGTAGVEDTSVYLHNKVVLYCRLCVR